MVSLECTGPCQRNGTSLVFIHCLQLFFLLLCGPSSQKHTTTFWNVWIKNNFFSRNMQHIKMRLVPFQYLICSLRCPQQKTTKFYHPIIEGVIHPTFQEQPSALWAATTINVRRAAAGSCSFLMVQKILLKDASEKEQETLSKNTWFVADYWMFRTVILNCF